MYVCDEVEEGLKCITLSFQEEEESYNFFDVRIKFEIIQKIIESIIFNRMKRHNIFANNNFHHSPMEEAEKHTAETIIQMSKIEKTLSSSACIQLTKLVIKGTTYQKRLCEFKKIQKMNNHDTLGKQWFHGILKRNLQVVTKRDVKCSTNWSEWCNFNNFVQMYDGIYNEPLDTGVAKKFVGNGK